jgi:prepilin-type processing-associated H-X9-DG protein
VVIAIIGILVGLLLPAVQAAREAARGSQCQSQLRQLALGTLLYYNANGAFPDGGGQAASGQTWSWAAAILPFVEETSLNDLIDYKQTYYSARNLPAIRTQVSLYQCPSAPSNQLVTCCLSIPGVADTSETNYLAVATHRQITEALDYDGSGVMFPLSHTRIRGIPDGMSKTLLICEVDALPSDPLPQQYPAYCPGSNCYVGYQWIAFAVATSFYGINSSPTYVEAGIQSWHPGMAQFAFADGHVASIPDDIDQNVLKALTTRNGGELIHGAY